MISVEEALQCVLSTAVLQPAEAIKVLDALDRVLASDIHSGCPLPPFNNSAMDGFALYCPEDGLSAGVELRISASQAAGDAAIDGQTGTCCEIMTGARMPKGFNAVVPIEQVEVLVADADSMPLRIRLNSAVVMNQHIRMAGEDVAEGEKVIAAGTRLGSRHLMVLAALGVAKIPVRKRVKVAVICTGRELVDDPSQKLLSGQIRNSNGPFLAIRLQQAGAELVYQATIADEVPHFITALELAQQAVADIIISTGAVSMGRYDFVPTALASLGAEILFHKVAMRPGKPLLFARLQTGQCFFGLPGNPVSSAVGLRFFIEPLLRKSYGQPFEQPWQLPLLHPVRKKAGFRLHQKAVLSVNGSGQLGVALMPGQESFKIKPLVSANVWAILPEPELDLQKGAMIEVVPLDLETPAVFELGKP
jgi:molybdopterin molybdotransferase